MTNHTLNDRQRLFVDRLVEGLSPEKAALAAGYSGGRSIAYRLIKQNVAVIKEIIRRAQVANTTSADENAMAMARDELMAIGLEGGGMKRFWDRAIGEFSYILRRNDNYLLFRVRDVAVWVTYETDVTAADLDKCISILTAQKATLESIEADRVTDEKAGQNSKSTLAPDDDGAFVGEVG